jgi:tetratricopeptide (TPR) repeat protein
MRAKHSHIRHAWILLLLTLVSCGEESAPPEPIPPLPDLNEQTQKGWESFRAGGYSASAGIFRELISLYPDAPAPYVGLGWCDIERDSLDAALDLFDHALRLDEEIDALAGTVVAASALALDALAVDAAYRVRRMDYIFQGNPQFGYRQVVYLRALAEFHLLRWDDCYASLKILDPDLDIDLDAWDFREQIFAALESLRERT